MEALFNSIRVINSAGSELCLSAFSGFSISLGWTGIRYRLGCQEKVWSG